MAKHSTTTICKAAIPALIVSYGGSVQAGESPSDINPISTDTSNTPTGQTRPVTANMTPRLVTVANASEQLNQYQYQGGKIDLNQVGFGQLQDIMDSFAQSKCAHAVQSSCRWKVLKLERTGRGKDGEQLGVVSAVSFPKVKRSQKDNVPNSEKSIRVASYTTQNQPSQINIDKPTPAPATYQPQVIASTVEQRMTKSEWAQAFSAPHPDETAIGATDLSTPVAINLPERSEVKLVVNGQEKLAETLEAGHNILDTKSLPEGSYPIEIHVASDINEHGIIHQMFGRRHLGVKQPTTSYGLFKPVSSNGRQVRTSTSHNEDVALQSTVVTSRGSKTGINANASNDASPTVDITLTRYGNQYQFALNGTISSQSALGNALKAAYLGKNLTVSIEDSGFVLAREMTGDPVLAKFLGAGEPLTLTDPVWLQGDIVFPLIAIRRQDPHYGLVESRADFATRLAHVVDPHSGSNAGLGFNFIDSSERGVYELKGTFHTRRATAIRPETESELEIETPFLHLASDSELEIETPFLNLTSESELEIETPFLHLA